jgi:thiosulfate/3-mercaptopyruvate sulfurtransferase
MKGPLIHPSELASRHAGAALLDVRPGRDGRARYDAGHLPGAVFVDLDRDLSEPSGDPAHGGRHPLPAPATFAARVGRWGIGPDTDVILYDALSGGNAAARAWWMLRALGHDRVQVLDGGYDAAIAAGLVPTTDVPSPVNRGAYPAATKWRWPTIDIDGVNAWRKDATKVVIDARSAPRFRGDEEPFDPVAGHIPGAVNLHHMSLVGVDGRLLPADDLARRLRAVTGERPVDAIAVHCGSGVTACHLILAMEQAGLGVPRLYVGSWSEWCRSDRER